MKQLTLTLAAILLLTGSTLADSYRVSYTCHGSGRRITSQAESSAEARRTIMDMFPDCYVTGAHKIKR
jgi:hypothetical protein